MKNNYINIYKDFVRASIDEISMNDVVKKYKLSRQRIYQIAEIVEKGKEEQYHKAVLAVKWKYIYSLTWSLVSGLGNEPRKRIFGKMVRNMLKDGFNVSEISDCTGRTRVTITKYLNQ